MSFKEDHPNYQSYKSDHLHYSDLPYNFSWSALESLVDEAGGPDRELLAKVVQKIAIKARAGSVSSGAPYQWIDHLVSMIRRQVSDGKFYVLMDCLGILCDDGDLTIETLNEFLEDYHIGYQAYRRGWNHGVVWDKVVDEDKVETEDIVEDILSDNTVLLLPNGRSIKSNEEMEAKMKDVHNRTEIFISHRTVDAEVADIIKDFLVNTGIPNDRIFCSSLPGNDVNERISPEVKEHLKKATIILLILSKDFYESAFCINEVGVAWYLDEIKTIPFGMPEISITDMVGFLNSDYILRRLDNDDDISYLYDQAQERVVATSVKYSIVTRESKKLKQKYQKLIETRTVVVSAKGGGKNDDEYNFGDEVETQEFNKQVIEVIRGAGGEVNDIT